MGFRIFRVGFAFCVLWHVLQAGALSTYPLETNDLYANNDLLFYHLDVRVDPETKFLRGKNTIRFRMLKDGRRIQLDLHRALHVDKIVLGTVRLKYRREEGAVFVDFPQTLQAGHDYSIDFYYSGHPVETGRFGAITFRKDPNGHPWVNTACEETGASVG